MTIYKKEWDVRGDNWKATLVPGNAISLVYNNELIAKIQIDARNASVMYSDVEGIPSGQLEAMVAIACEYFGQDQFLYTAEIK